MGPGGPVGKLLPVELAGPSANRFDSAPTAMLAGSGVSKTLGKTLLPALPGWHL